MRSWLRGILGASGVTLLVPAGLLAAIAVAAAVGGSGLGSVGQLIGGPEVPGGSAAVPSDDAALPTVPRRGGPGLAERTSRREAAARRSAARRVAEGERRVADRSPSRGGGDRPSDTARPGTTTPATSPPTGTTPDATPPPPPRPPPGERNPVRRLTKAVTNTVRKVPVVGPPAADAVDTVIDLVIPPDPKNPVRKLLGQ